MRPNIPARPFWGVILAVAALKLLVHLLAISHYGYFRDELYFLACADHLDWGYVDQAPLVAVYAWLGKYAFGGSLAAVRILPVMAGVAKVVLTGMITARLGGGRAAQLIACTATLVAGVFLAIDNLLSMNPFEPVFWMACVYVLLLILEGGDQRLWMLFGALAGLGLENKHSTAFFLLAFAVAVAVTPAREQLRSKWLWMGVAIAFVIALPNLLWQVNHDWATLELLRNVKNSGKNVVFSPAEFLKQQVMMLTPVTLLLWLPGLWFVLFGSEGRRFRVLGVLYFVLLAIMVKLEAKDYYLAPIYPMLFAAGAVMWQPLLRNKWITTGLMVAMLAMGTIAALAGMPLLEPAQYLAFTQRIGLKPSRSEVAHNSAMPQHLAEQFGWREMAEQTAAAYHAMPEGMRARTGIFAGNYGEAGAIDFFGPELGLPKAISGHQNYYLWGPRDYDGSSLIVIAAGTSQKELEVVCAKVTVLGKFYHPYAMPSENNEFFHCEGTKVPLKDYWPKVKQWH